MTSLNCPGCGSTNVSIFYEVSSVPVQSVVLLDVQQAALDYPTGNIQLALCSVCSFIFNMAFDSKLMDYSEDYESTQSYSPTFNRFAGDLAAHLVQEYGLQQKTVIEIGCGQGEFLALMCEEGAGRGIGFDPAFDPSRAGQVMNGKITFIRDYYSPENAMAAEADFVCCRMTLEHISNAYEFVSMVRQSIGPRSDTPVFFQVPDVDRILGKTAFWDIYYEHCSYFGLDSLGHLFARCGFEVVNAYRAFDDQYAMIEALTTHRKIEPMPEETGSAGMRVMIAEFQEQVYHSIDEWKSRIVSFNEEGRRVVIWGASSKAVAFHTTLESEGQISFAVDVNPLKEGTYLPGTSVQVVTPPTLKEIRPDIVIVMNPIYRDEIEAELGSLGVDGELLDVESRPN